MVRRGAIALALMAGVAVAGCGGNKKDESVPLKGTVKTYSGPVSNDTATVTFKQAIGATDALRTGTYSKTLTFTLSTTNP